MLLWKTWNQYADRDFRSHGHIMYVLYDPGEFKQSCGFSAAMIVRVVDFFFTYFVPVIVYIPIMA